MYIRVYQKIEIPGAGHCNAQCDTDNFTYIYFLLYLELDYIYSLLYGSSFSLTWNLVSLLGFM